MMSPALLLAGLVVAPAQAQETEFTFGGALSMDTRYRITPLTTGEWYSQRTLDTGFSRNEHKFNMNIGMKGPKIRGKADVDLVYWSYPEELTGLAQLSSREAIDPFRIEAHSLYFEAWDVMLPGLDLRVGQQLVQLGVGDQFNPTNNMNADDVEDPLRFGDQLGNLIARADYSPRGNWTFTSAIAPIFKPAIVPSTGEMAFASIDRIPITDDALRWRLLTDAAFGESTLGFPTVVDEVIPILPEPDISNAQWFLSLGGSVGMQDVAVSYFNGRSDFPAAVTNLTSSELYDEPVCDPADPEQCIDGLLMTDTILAYPRMQVYGFNAAGEVNPLGWIGPKLQPIGYRLEFAWILPERTEIALVQEDLDFGNELFNQEAGEYDYGGEDDTYAEGERPLSVDGRAFAKWAAGLDYTFTRWLYVNAQWVHGMPDEFGAGDWLQDGFVVREGEVISEAADTAECFLEQDSEPCTRELLRHRIGDYAVIGADMRFGATLIRLFAITDLTGFVEETWDEDAGKRVRRQIAWSTPEGRSMVLYPELQYNFGNSLEVAGGALVMVGEDYSRFGEAATGGTQLFARGRYSF